MKIVFVKSGRQPLEVIAEPGARILDLCDAHRAPVPFSCRGTSCATCCVRVLSGAEHLDEAGDEELQVLDGLGYVPEKNRLACTARVGMSAGLHAIVTLEAENDE